MQPLSESRDVTEPPPLVREDLTALFQEHRAGLAGAVRGVAGSGADVQEVLQEAFLRAWRSWPAQGAPQDPKAWIFVITLNLARDLRRRRQRRPAPLPLEENQIMRLEAERTDPLDRLQTQESVEAARRAIQDLRDAEREVFLLRTSAGLTFEAIARALAIPTGTAKTRMRAALARLRHVLTTSTPAFGPGKEAS